MLIQPGRDTFYGDICCSKVTIEVHYVRYRGSIVENYHIIWNYVFIIFTPLACFYSGPQQKLLHQRGLFVFLTEIVTGRRNILSWLQLSPNQWTFKWGLDLFIIGKSSQW